MKRVRRIGLLGVVALIGALAIGPAATAADAGDQAFTSTTATTHPVTTVRVDLAPAPAPECDFPGRDPVLVDQMSVAKDPVTSATVVVGPADIMIGEDQSVPYHVPSGDVNTNTNVAYETVVTQYFQAVEPGPPRAPVRDIHLTTEPRPTRPR